MHALTSVLKTPPKEVEYMKKRRNSESESERERARESERARERICEQRVTMYMSVSCV